jgi:hypothetical protein
MIKRYYLEIDLNSDSDDSSEDELKTSFSLRESDSDDE